MAEEIEPAIIQDQIIMNGNPMCIICNCTMQNACNGLCGCKYCWDCIETYLNGEEKCCPGDSNDCKKELLNIEGNILVDQSTQKQISRIVVKCAESGKSPDESKKINEDLIEYQTGAVKCPYSSLGCCQSKLIRNEMDEHLNFLNYSHTKLLMQWIDNLRNELKSIKLDIALSRRENRDLQKQLDSMKLADDKKQAAISELLIRDEIKCQQIDDLMHELHHGTHPPSDEPIRLVDNEPVIIEYGKH